MKHKKGDIIRFHYEDEPTDGKAIEARFGSGCHTPCPYGNSDIMVGSLSCQWCEHYAGASPVATATGGDDKYGGTTHTRKIYCCQEQDAECLPESYPDAPPRSNPSTWRSRA